MQLLGSSKQAAVASLPSNWWKITQPVASDFLPSDTSLRHAKIKAEVRRGNVEHVLPMIALKARATWDKLPKYAQVWYTVQDLIAEGTAHISNPKFLRLHKNNGPAGFVTYCWTSLDNLYKDRLKAVYADKRFVRAIYSADSSETLGRQTREVYSLYDKLKARPDKFAVDEIRIISRIDAERAFLRLYAQSDSRLRRYLIMWILQPSNTKFKTMRYSESKGRVVGNLTLFEEIKVEFLSTQINLELCDFIQTDFDCRRNIARQLVKNYRTPKPNATKVKDFKDSVESLVSKIAFSKPLYERGYKRRW